MAVAEAIVEHSGDGWLLYRWGPLEDRDVGAPVIGVTHQGLRLSGSPRPPGPAAPAAG
jgi:hypothetical protein